MAERSPTAIPAMKRPAINMAIVAEPACKAQPRAEMQPPKKTAFFRPNISASHDIASAPTIAPPVKEDTIPPFWEEFGVPK